MRKIIFFMNISLDGIIGGAEADGSNTSDSASTDTPSEEEHIYANDVFASSDTILFGRTTYEGFTSYWDNIDVHDASKPKVELNFATMFQQKNRVVFSRTLKEVPKNTLLISDNIKQQVERLKQQRGGDMVLVCGSELFATLIDIGVIDEVQLIILPKAYGKGQSLFGKLRKSLNMSFLESKPFASGSILARYSVLRTGTP